MGLELLGDERGRSANGGPDSRNQHCQSAASRMIEDMAARKLGPHTQGGHIHGCKRFAA
jgi:hypothetical protein